MSDDEVQVDHAAQAQEDAEAARRFVNLKWNEEALVYAVLSVGERLAQISEDLQALGRRRA
jgi:hypothetical protein